MHILMTADTVGGVWTYTRELVAGLLRRGHRVTLVSFGGQPTPDQAQWMQGLENLLYLPTTFRLEWMQGSGPDMTESRKWLTGLIQQVAPDVLHFNQYGYGALPTPIPKVVVAHSDVVSWWVNTRGEEPPDAAWIRDYRELVTEGIASADAVIAPSQWMLNCLRLYFSFSGEGQVIYNARDAALFDRMLPKQQCVLSVGRIWDEAKQVSLLTESRHPVPVYIAGSIDHPEKLYAGSARLNESPSVQWLGPQSFEGLRKLYAEAAIYVGTSRYEPFGLAPLEAALSGCALLLNDIPTFRELWGDAATYFRHNNSESLAAGIRSLIDNPQQRECLAGSALQRAATMFHPDRMLDGYEHLYKSLTAQEAYA